MEQPKPSLFQSKKQVLARSMTRQEYNDYRGWTLPENEQHLANEAGYLVEYVDGGTSNDPRHEGYISWSPSDVFSRSHSMIDTPKQRLQLEQRELFDNLTKLEEFLDKGKPEFISEDHWDLLQAQFTAMDAYNDILAKRIFKF